jgi:hypothetical protein|tara:strand:- start:259 stop:495 length:237 start_codon:yes stop_codon:yes gene_type:complete
MTTHAFFILIPSPPSLGNTYIRAFPVVSFSGEKKLTTGTNRTICESFHRNNDFAVCVSRDVQLIVEDANAPDDPVYLS